ncbi:fatty acid desaturase-domain-containing protein [Amylocystis lapponica]|nr:fatty acid desaturase-domain-containing protein [Amylocystis lapponica]
MYTIDRALDRQRRLPPAVILASALVKCPPQNETACDCATLSFSSATMSPKTHWKPSYFCDAPEYEARKKQTQFTPPDFAIKDVHAAVPRHLFEKSTLKSLFYVGRHLGLTAAFYVFATHIDRIAWELCARFGYGHRIRGVLEFFMWALYWFWQSVSFSGIWTLGHECGHDALSPIGWVNAAIGLALHTFILTPYYAWRITHRTHHKGTNHLDRDETYHPATRTDLHLPEEKFAKPFDYKEIIEETPGYTLFKLVVRQFFGFQLYLIHNRKGNPKYPPWTSHYKPSSQLFKQEDRQVIIISDVAIGTMLALLSAWIYQTSWPNVWRLYFVPWLWAHNWIVMFTYLQHSDPTVPYYRENEWSFLRGALATVDRPVFGWIGRFFWHGIAHHHIAHHFFSSIPFYNLPEVTEAIKPVLGAHYNYDSTPTIYALWRSFTQCTFIEPVGDVVFFKNQQGEAVREYLATGLPAVRDRSPVGTSN